MITLSRDLHGSILDIGGGGEGVIGLLYGSQVTAIDNRQEELDEAPDGFQKVLMDARCLSYPSEHFDHVTFFYSLMFMDTRTQEQAIREAARVLKKDGFLHIWDADILSAYPEPFLTDLDIQLPGRIFHTTFGVISDIQNQSAASVCRLCVKSGLRLIRQTSGEGQFHMVFAPDSAAPY